MSGSSAGGGGTGQIGSIGSYMSQGAPSLPTSFGGGVAVPNIGVGAPVGLTQGQNPFATMQQILGPGLRALLPGGPIDQLIKQIYPGGFPSPFETSNRKKGQNG